MKKLFTFLLMVLSGLAIHAQCLLPLLNCTPSDTICDNTSNDPLFWNYALFWDSVASDYNLAEGDADLSFSYRDSCGDATVSFLLLLDLNDDGIHETALTPAHILSGGRMLWKNAANPGYGGTDTITFDYRAIPPTQRHQFLLQTQVNADSATVSLRWAPGNDLNSFHLPQLPYGHHKIIWTVANTTDTLVCEEHFFIKDCAAPIVACIQGLSVNIGPSGFIHLWATDFFQYALDNYTMPGDLQIGIERAGTGNGFPEDSLNNPVTTIDFYCADLGPQLVELWVRDAYGYTDSCTTTIIIQDNGSNCGTADSSNVVCIKTACANEPMANVNILLDGMNPGWPPVFNYGVTDSTGCWTYVPALPIGGQFGFTPIKDDNPLNGVSTYDLVLISKHILGLQILPSPYAMIAADVNKSNSITTFDIVELRRLIIGVYQELPNNTSWRFVDENFVFLNPFNPFSGAFPESIIYNPPGMAASFLGIKIGDVNCNALPVLGEEIEDRGSRHLTLRDRVLEPGQELEIPIYAAQQERWDGFQLSFAADPALIEIVGVIPGNLPGMESDVFNLNATGTALNASWITPQGSNISLREPLFYVKIRARSAGRLSEGLRLAPGPLRPEAYPSSGGVSRMELLYELGDSRGFAARPNPTSGGFELPLQLDEPGDVLLQLRDSRGVLVYQNHFMGNAGFQIISVPATAFSATGVYFWQMSGSVRHMQGKVVRQ